MATSVETSQREPFGSSFSCIRTTFEGAYVLGRHAHERATLSVPFRGGYVERFAGGEVDVDADAIFYRSAEFEHADRIRPGGFDGVLVEIEPRREIELVDALGA